MNNLKDMIGSVKRIYNVTNSSTKTVDAMIVDYTYNPNTSTYRQHKLDYVTTSGIIGNMYINENTTFSNLEISDDTKKNLLLIKDCILRKKEFQKGILKESELIELYTKELLKEENALSQEAFINDLVSKLLEKSVVIHNKSINRQKVHLTFNINPNIYLDISIQKHYVRNFRLSCYRNTNKTFDEISFVGAKSYYCLEVLNKDKYKDFIKDYIMIDSNNSNVIEFLESNKLSLNYNSNNLVCDKEDELVYFESLNIIEPNKDNTILLNNNTINMNLNLIDFVN